LYGALENGTYEEVKSFVSASAIGIYPTSQGNYYDESCEQVDDSFLGEVVAKWEKEIDTFKTLNLNVAKVRVGLVMSNSGGALPEIAKPVKYGLGAAFGTGNQWQSWIHITDLAKMFLFLGENKITGVYNGVAPNPVSNTKLVKEIAKALQKPFFLPNIPKFVMKTILGEMSYILFASQRVSSKKIEEEGFNFRFRNICSALEDIYALNDFCAPKEATMEKKYAS